LNHPLKTSKTGDVTALLFNAAVKKLKPAKDNIASTEFLSLEGVRIVLAILPTACSRHNTATRAWGVTDAVKHAKLEGSMSVVFLLPGEADHVYAQAVSVARPFWLYSSKTGAKQAEARRVNVVLSLPGGAAAEQSESGRALLREVSGTATGIRLCQRLVDAPPNELHVTSYVAECLAAAEAVGAAVTVIRGEELRDRGFGGIWGVGKASEHLPALVVLSHTPPEAEGGESVCLVGKGIVYDTGGNTHRCNALLTPPPPH